MPDACLHNRSAALDVDVNMGGAQRERSEQLRSLSMVAGVMDGFAMSSLLQLNFSAKNISYRSPAVCGYSLTLGITVRVWPPLRLNAERLCETRMLQSAVPLVLALLRALRLWVRRLGAMCKPLASCS